MAIDEFLTGLAAFLGTYLIHSTVMLAGAWIGVRWIRMRSGLKEMLWRTALVAPVLTSALAIQPGFEPLAGEIGWIERMRAGAPVTQPAPPAPVAPLADGAATLPVPAAPGPGTASLPEAPSPGHALGQAPGVDSGLPAWLAAAALAWLTVAVLLTARRLRGARAGRSMLAHRRPVASGPAREALVRLTVRGGMEAPALSACDALGGPATLPSGEICIPEWALALPAGQLEAMLAHELAHVERRDPWWLALAVSLESLFWLQPLNRIARRRLAGLAELHADARAAQLTRDGRALAVCLARCAEKINAGHMPALAAAMARQGGALSERVRRLITDSTETGDIPMSRKFLIFAGVIALVMVLPSMTVLATKSESGRTANVSIHDADAKGARSMSLSLSDDDMRLKLEASGDYVFAPDDSGLEHMGPGSELEVVHDRDGTGRKLIARGTGDAIEYTYYVDGDERPYGDDARAWFAGILPMIMRETAVNAPGRVEYILEQEGHGGVLDEIARIRSDFARRHYIEAYTATGKLPADAYDRLLEEAGEIGSDFELRRALTVIYGTQSPRGDRLTALVETAESIGSEFELRQLLTALAEDAVRDEAVLKAYAEAAGRIGSDFELRQALTGLIEADEGSSAVYAALPLTKLIGSDFELRVLLEKAAPAAARDERLGIAWLGASARIGSDFELRQALMEFASKDPDSIKVWRTLFEAAQGIASDRERARFLLEVADDMPDDPEVREAFRSVMETIGSDREYRRVAEALER